jgi:hypothetical protein
MSPRRRGARALPSRQAGSALVLVLFACLATAAVLQSLSAVLLCAERALVDESTGRGRLAERDEALAILRQQALTLWQPGGWRTLSVEEDPRRALGEGAISELPGGDGWVMSAAARQDPAVSRLTTSAWLERGRDGIDLPLAAVVAEVLTATAGRTVPWVEIDRGESSDAGSAAGAVVHVVRPMVEPLLGAGCAGAALGAAWRLDPGWANVDLVVARSSGAAAVGAARAGGAAAEGTAAARGVPTGQPATSVEGRAVAPGPGVTWLRGRFGGWESLPMGSEGLTPATPMLVVLTGGATLDVRNREDIYGVVVVDDGSVLLDGTSLHGAVFAGGTVDLGASGRLMYSRSILRWATDRSLNRVRLVPGTREEGTE